MRGMQVDWQEYNRRMRVGAVAFVTMPNLRSNLAVLTLCGRPHVGLMGRILALSSSYKARKAYLGVPTRDSKFPVVEAARGAVTDPFFQDAARLLSEPEALFDLGKV